MKDEKLLTTRMTCSSLNFEFERANEEEDEGDTWLTWAWSLIMVSRILGATIKIHDDGLKKIQHELLGSNEKMEE
ncbi:unnamed protein product [Lathyrus oleraceus]